MSAEQLQQFEARLDHLSSQRRTFQAQLSEVESALSEIGSEDVYQVVGNLMLKRSVTTVKEELVERKETLGVRIRSFEKQEEVVRQQLKNLQKELVESLQQHKENNNRS
jgi:prefoldin beta subunit